MIQVIVGTTTTRNTKNYTADTTLRYILEDNAVDYSVAQVMLDGASLQAGDMDKITVVIWFEGDDPECVDDILEGEIKFSMDINVIEELDNGGEAA